MGLIDTHTHLESFVRKGTLDAALAEAAEAGVEAMITIGTGPDDWDVYRSLAMRHPRRIHYTVGLHPCSVEPGWGEVVAQIERYWEGAGRQSEAVGLGFGAAPPNPVALGECGLDRFHLPKDPAAASSLFQQQRGAFAAQLEIARRIGCPVVVHSRGAFRECLEMVDASGVDWPRVVFHCFSEGAAEMAELTRRGGVGSFTGILTYRSAEPVREAAKRQGLAALMLETDAPYLTPMPHRGKPNRPALVRHTAEFAAEQVFGIPTHELGAITTENARRFFDLKPSA